MPAVALSSRPALAQADIAAGDLIPVVDVSEATPANRLKKTTFADLAGAVETAVLPAVNAVKATTEGFRDQAEVFKDAAETAADSVPLLAFPSRTFVVDAAFAGLPSPAFTSVTAAITAAQAKVAAEGGEVFIMLRHGAGGVQLSLAGSGFTQEGLRTQGIVVSAPLGKAVPAAWSVLPVRVYGDSGDYSLSVNGVAISGLTAQAATNTVRITFPAALDARIMMGYGGANYDQLSFGPFFWYLQDTGTNLADLTFRSPANVLINPASAEFDAVFSFLMAT